MAQIPSILGISGSLRSSSFSEAVFRGLADALKETADFSYHGLGDVPLYNQDLDTEDAPFGVASLRRAIGEADAVVIVSAEYNHGIPGVLKNALDWASRPYGQSTLTGKPVFTITCSPAATGGVRAHAQLNETLASIAARIVLRPQAVIPSVHDKIIDGRLADRVTLEFIAGGVSDLIRMAQGPSMAVVEEA